MLTTLRAASVALVAFTLLTGVVYPLAVTGIARVAFPDQAAGSLIVRDGKVVGSSLIGQSTDNPRDFWGRPSATSPAPYQAGASSGSNLGPMNPDLLTAVRQRVENLQRNHPGETRAVPVDLVTSSASGLDPHISPAAAEYQVSRVAKARGVLQELVRERVARHTEGCTLGLFGEPRVNVLELNLDLDGLAAGGP